MSYPTICFALPPSNHHVETNVHSRAARRAVSPSIDLDKSITTAPRAASPESKPKLPTPNVLAAKSAGITKKTKSKPLKRQQRLRQQKGIERAEDVLDKMELKVQKSVGRERKVKERRKGWEEVNEIKKKRRKQNAFEALEDGEEAGRKDREWVSDEEMDGDVNGGAEDGMEDNVVVPEIAGEVKKLELVDPESVPLPAVTVEEDEML